LNIFSADTPMGGEAAQSGDDWRYVVDHVDPRSAALIVIDMQNDAPRPAPRSRALPVGRWCPRWAAR
jgi:hypothetical protein